MLMIYCQYIYSFKFNKDQEKGINSVRKKKKTNRMDLREM